MYLFIDAHRVTKWLIVVRHTFWPGNIQFWLHVALKKSKFLKNLKMFRNSEISQNAVP